MAKADGSVIIDITSDPKQAINGINRVEKSVEGLASTAKKLAKVLAAAFTVDKIASFAKEAIGLASDMQEVQNVVDTAFGEMAYKAEEFAAASIEQFGMSQLEAKRTSSTYMAMARGMGIAEEAASDMAISLTGLTGDVASFYNISQSEASTKLKSIFTGETESLKDLGVVMTQTNLNAFAMANGFGTTIDKLNQAQQTQLRYMYVTQQLGLAQGDFAKTSGSWANQTRILSEQWKQLLSIIGNGLIQALTPAIQALNQFMSTLIQWAQQASQTIAGVFGIEASNSPAESSVENLTTGIGSAAAAEDNLSASTAKATKEMQKQLAGFDEINVLQTTSTSGSEGSGGSSFPSLSVPSVIGADMKVSPKIDAVTNSVKKKFQGLSDWFAKTFAPSISSWSKTFSDLKVPIGSAASSISSSFNDLWQNTLSPFGNYLVQEWVPNIVNSFSTNLAPVFSDVMAVAIEEFSKDFDFMCLQIDNLVNDILRPAFEFIGKVFSDICEGIKNTWDKYGAGLLENIQKFRDSIKEIWQNLYDNILKPIFEGIGNTISDLWDNHLKYLWENITEFIASVSNMIMTIWNKFLAPIVNWLIQTFGPIISDVINEVGAVIGAIFGNISDVVGGVIQVFTGLIDFITGVFSGDWGKAWDGIVGIFKGIFDGIFEIIKAPINAIIGLINGVIDAINWIIDGINSISFDMPDWLGGAHIGFNIGKIGKIPYLAQGAVIPPNREFMAVLGDQSSGRNLETPERLLRQIVREESGNSEMLAVLEAILEATRAGRKLYVDKKVLAQTAKDGINDMTIAAGKPVLLY